ncbi:MAG: glycosyltransferase family 4 protein [Paraburkholderia sp.]|uniref:glycosyltransferase family 4 protein n=1 Tax=Paraburkholderia sp. TaxID=1926495 RepID=UPI0011FB017E|nr:glycosyltransferase family 4 protein [Paraburkholderia sp.]TAM06246.1 MAG: glycosyltransferase family 4 protein [Paraburkholderia sp.]TAM31939.1 MAG: glycosyltransferase family 4 protein [Paraburkholderia sp.]
MAELAKIDAIAAGRRRFGRVALVHDWLASYAGSERVVEQILKLWPDAELFSVVDFFPEELRADVLRGKHATTSFIQNLPRARTAFRIYLPLMPLAVEQFDLSSFDLVISSSHAVAKGVITGPNQVHVSYVHSPIRYAWDLQHQYLAQARKLRGPKSWVARAALHYMRIWDMRTANGVDEFVANSAFVGRRIRKIYGRSAQVVYPPVDVERFAPTGRAREDFYLTASRMVPYKRIPLLVEAFSKMPDRRLIVIGDGPDFETVRELAGPNISVLGYQPSNVLIDHMQRARAFVFAAEEDFGISVVEAQACGTPVIAYGRGGALETVIDSGDPRFGTGLFFYEQSVEAIVDTIKRFEARAPFDDEVCRLHAARFSAARFRQEFLGVVERAVERHPTALLTFEHRATAEVR